MTNIEKILIGLGVTGLIAYLVTRPTSSAGGYPPANISKTDAERVMSYASLMLKYASEQGVDPALIASVMTIESRGIDGQVGSSGEIGLMQIMPSTGKWIGDVSVEQLSLASVNIQIGTAYLRYCIDRKGGNGPAGIAAYNYGPDRVVVRGSAIIVPDTVKRYVDNVLSLIDRYREAFRIITGGSYRPPDGFILSGLPCRRCGS